MKSSIRLMAILCLAVLMFAASAMPREFFSANYLPHRFCYLAQPGLIWTNVSMDSAIAASYALIFASLVWISTRLRRVRELRAYLWIALSFATFILACAATHVMEVVTVWWPIYPMSAAVKAVCALASVVTAVLFVRAAPKLAASVILFVDMEAALRVANAKLLKLSVVDSLTGLTNRGHFDSMFAAEWIRAQRSGSSLALLMMDVDHFKMLNDRYGHLGGDDCLRRVARVMAERRGRPDDVTARYGGEEFAMILPGCNLADAYKIAESIRCAVAALALPNADAPTGPTVTMTIGVASHSPRLRDEAKELMAAADAALYRAKRLGRNRTEAGHLATV